MEEKTILDETDMYTGFELFQKFLKDRDSLTPLEVIKLNQIGINFS